MKAFTLLIGHRGTGKSSLLKYFEQENYIVMDLDEELEKQSGQNIKTLFAKGETAFRQFELKLLRNILRSTPSKKMIIAVGAGFHLDKLKVDHVNVDLWWLKRDSDSKGRIFFDRPRLTTKKSALKESLSIYKERNPRYQQHCTRSFGLPEGSFSSAQYVKFWDHVKAGESLGGGYIKTIRPQTNLLFCALEDLYLTGLDRVELRNDLLRAEEILELLTNIPHKRILLSVRAPLSRKLMQTLDSFYGDVDLDARFVKKYASIVSEDRLTLSLHSSDWKKNKKLIQSWVQRFPKAQIKYAPPLSNLKELMSCHQFFEKMRETTKVTFLPRSWDGRWRWYRLQQSNQNVLNFVRDNSQEVLDLSLIHI